MTTMEEEPIEKSPLFCPENKPMIFKIMITDGLLNIEIQRVLTHIDREGGEFEGFDLDDSKYIVLASPKYKPPANKTVFSIKYVKKCVKEGKLLSLNNFQLSGDEFSRQRCLPFEKLVEAKRCPHLLTAQEVIKEMESLRRPEQAKPKPTFKNALTEMMEKRGKREKTLEKETERKTEKPKKITKNIFEEMMKNRKRNKPSTNIPKETHRDEILTENSRKRKRETEIETERRTEREPEKEPAKKMARLSTLKKIDLATAHLIIKKQLALQLEEKQSAEQNCASMRLT